MMDFGPQTFMVPATSEGSSIASATAFATSPTWTGGTRSPRRDSNFSMSHVHGASRAMSTKRIGTKMHGSGIGTDSVPTCS